MAAIFRFAPSPNGFLHAGHAFSALLNAQLADSLDGAFLLRMEDIDTTRCTRALEAAAIEDLHWLGLRWPEPVRRQSDHLDAYRRMQADLADAGLLYPCFCTRGAIARAIAGRKDWPRDPDGSPLYPGTCRALAPDMRTERCAREPHAWRIDMAAAAARVGALQWREWVETGFTAVDARPEAWGDVVLARKDIGTSYHVAVVLDDALQGVTHVVRGRDLFAATAVHRVLQTLLGLPAPVYRHHPVLRDAAGDKLAKSRGAMPLRQRRAEGLSPQAVRRSLGFA